MLLLMMELKGRFNSKMIKKAKFGDVYFDELGAFNSIERDRVTGSVRVALRFNKSVVTHVYFYCRMSCARSISRSQAETSDPDSCRRTPPS